MKVIREPQSRKTHQIICINEQCQAHIECETHELQYVPNSHKGDYYLMHCPCCGIKTAIDGNEVRSKEVKLDGC
jgi:hypothetical protein